MTLNSGQKGPTLVPSFPLLDQLFTLTRNLEGMMEFCSCGLHVDLKKAFGCVPYWILMALGVWDKRPRQTRFWCELDSTRVDLRHGNCFPTFMGLLFTRLTWSCFLECLISSKYMTCGMASNLTLWLVPDSYTLNERRLKKVKRPWFHS